MSTEKPDYLLEEDSEQEVILKRMLSKVMPGVDISEGSYVWDSLAPASIELAFVGMAIRKALALGFAQTTDIEHLEKRAEEHGVLRKGARQATAVLTVQGKPGSVVPAGLRVATEADADIGVKSVFFYVEKSAIIPEEGIVKVKVIAEKAGTEGNVAAGSIVLLATSRNTIFGITNKEAAEGGVDIESFAALQTRYFDFVRNPGTSGNIADYVHWANEVSGVGAVHVLPLWNGPGTVKLVILSTDHTAPNEDLVAAVQAYIAPSSGGERLAPIGATVTVEAAETLAVDIEATLLLDAVKTVSLAEIKEKFEAALISYFYKTAFQLDVVRYARLGSILVEQDGVVDYVDFTLNGGTTNIPVAVYQVAELGTVTLHAK